MSYVGVSEACSDDKVIVDLFTDLSSTNNYINSIRPRGSVITMTQSDPTWLNVLGLSRDIRTIRSIYDCSSSASKTFVGFFTYLEKNDSLCGASTTIVHWGGTIDGALSTTGLRGIDFTKGGATRLEMTIGPFSGSAYWTLKIDLWDMGANTSSVSYETDGTGIAAGFVVPYSYSDFVGVDMTNIGAIRLTITPSAATLHIYIQSLRCA